VDEVAAESNELSGTVGIVLLLFVSAQMLFFSAQ
jgi:hypothetical protein